MEGGYEASRPPTVGGCTSLPGKIIPSPRTRAPLRRAAGADASSTRYQVTAQLGIRSVLKPAITVGAGLTMISGSAPVHERLSKIESPKSTM